MMSTETASIVGIIGALAKCAIALWQGKGEVALWSALTALWAFLFLMELRA